MKKRFFLLILIFSAQSLFATRPNLNQTPGELCNPSNPDFAGYRYQAHVAYCTRNVDHDKKLLVAKAYGIPESEWKNYEFDHLIPLNSGGDSSVANLWPEPIGEAQGIKILQPLSTSFLHTNRSSVQ